MVKFYKPINPLGFPGCKELSRDCIDSLNWAALQQQILLLGPIHKQCLKWKNVDLLNCSCWFLHSNYVLYSHKFYHALLIRKSFFLSKGHSTSGSKISFISNLKKPVCASKRDVLELATLRYVMKSEIVIATTKQNSDGMHKKSLLKFWYLLLYSLNDIAYKENFSYLDWDWILIW